MAVKDMEDAKDEVAVEDGVKELGSTGPSLDTDNNARALSYAKERQADLCIEFMKLGMDLEGAFTAVGVPDDIRDALASDEEFVGRANYALARREEELLRRLNEVAMENADRGDTRQLERLLELMNPARYSKVTKLSHQVDTHGGAQGKVTVEFTGGEG